jgi:pantoate--beta-alanine ligase
MRLVDTRRDAGAWADETRRDGHTIALVPTMGYLHTGHLSLLDLAAKRADRVALSIFVNPLQFGPGEDLDRYPRDLDRDLDLARDAGADLVFAPGTDEMYPDGSPWTTVVPARGADRLCGASRPGHFSGVLTVVARLFGIFHPDVAVFGQKDYQQLVLIRHMVDDLEMGVTIEAAPIVREPDGLAMSSRNIYLDDEGRRRALGLSLALRECETLFRSGEDDADRYRAKMRAVAGSDVDLEYADVVDPRTLEPTERVFNGAVCAVAGRVDGTRLIDNTVLRS